MVHFPIGSGHVGLMDFIQIFSPLRGVEGAHGAFSNREWACGGDLHENGGAILKKMAVSLKENALRVGLIF